MGNYQEINGNLITMALEGHFDVIVHGCNTFCIQGAGIAPQMNKAFGTLQFPLEDIQYRGNINKLGQIDWELFAFDEFGIISKYTPNLTYDENQQFLCVVNAYTQYDIKPTYSDIPFDYEAFTLCMRKLNHVFKGNHIGLPQIGSGLAQGDWDRIKQIIQDELTKCQVTVVIYDGK